MSIKDIVKASVDFTMDRVKKEGSTNSGDSAKLASSGKNSVVMSAGIDGKVKAAVGNWIAIAEWEMKDSHFVPVGIVVAQVDGEKVKADTWYKAKNGQLAEAEGE